MIGKFLYEPESLAEVHNNTNAYLGVDESFEGKYFLRFIFDNIFNIMLVWIVINLVGGIIIDRFRELKDALDYREKDEKNLCFICGFDR